MYGSAIHQSSWLSPRRYLRPGLEPFGRAARHRAIRGWYSPGLARHRYAGIEHARPERGPRDAQDGKRYAVPGAAWDLALTPGATSPPLSFSQPTSPAPSSPHRYVLVFRGTLGLEPDAVAGQLVTLTTHTLRVTKSGGGTGSVASTPPGITCGGDCTEDYCTTRR